jgi:type IV pilus assembly protein PilA
MKKNGFTLIELLVVVAIIGILAAVGITAYSGYTTAAKTNKTIANHKMLTKYLSTEFLTCETGLRTRILDNTIFCTQRDGATVMGALLTPARRLVTQNPWGDPNPDWGNVGVIIDAAQADKNLGYITINSSRGDIVLHTCFQTPCNVAENRIQNWFRTQDRN